MLVIGEIGCFIILGLDVLELKVEGFRVKGLVFLWLEAINFCSYLCTFSRHGRTMDKFGAALLA